MREPHLQSKRSLGRSIVIAVCCVLLYPFCDHPPTLCVCRWMQAMKEAGELGGDHTDGTPTSIGEWTEFCFLLIVVYSQIYSSQTHDH